VDFGTLLGLMQAGIPLAVVLLIAAVVAFSTGRVYSRDAMERQRAETDRERREKEREREETDRWIATSFRLVDDGRDLKRGAVDALAEVKARIPERSRHSEPRERRDDA
jgi:predicted phosphoribosyltransferase